ncbi:MAG: hypothetical protein KDE19_19095 [Caldilineaceae bacterium]|nr:hypothetical protein [Caldilineaceae bacterium]
MTGSTETLQLTLLLETGQDADLAEARDLTVRLRDELLNSHSAIDATLTNQTLIALPRSKSPTQITSDPILLTLAVTAIPSVILLIQQWLLRQQNQTIKVKIGEAEMEVPRNATQAEIDRVVNAVRRITPTKRK